MWMFCLLVRSLLPSVAPALHQPAPAITSSLPSAREMPSHHLLKVAQAARRLWHTPPRGTCRQAGAQIPGGVFGSHISLNVFKYIICGRLAAQAKGEASALPKSPAACACRHTFTHTHVHTFANIYIYTHMYTHAYIYTRTHKHMHQMRIHVHMHTHNHTYIHIYSCVHTHSHVQIPHACTHRHTHKHVHMSAHTRRYTSLPLPLQGLNPTVTEVPSQSSLPWSLPCDLCSVGAPHPGWSWASSHAAPRYTPGFLSVSTADVGWITLCPGGRPVCGLAASLVSTH